MYLSSFVIHLFTSGVTDLNGVTSAIPCAPGIPARPLMLFQHAAFNGVPISEVFVHFVHAFGTCSFICGLLACCVFRLLNIEVCSTSGAFSLGSVGSLIFSLFLGCVQFPLVRAAFFSRCISSRYISVKERQKASASHSSW